MGGKGKEEMSNKTKQKQKAKVVEDLTFGLKNKNKSKVVQKYCKEVQNRVMFSDVKVSFRRHDILVNLVEFRHQAQANCVYRVVLEPSKSKIAKSKRKRLRRRPRPSSLRIYSNK